MSCSTRIRLAAALCGAALLTLTGCAIEGSAVPGEADVRGLETGTYAVDRHHFDDTAGAKGALVEGMRMSAAVAPAVRIDSSLTYGRGGAVVGDVTRALDFVANVSRPVLEKRKYVTGYAALGADKPDPADSKRPSADATAVSVFVLRFPDATAATLAARELEDADLAVSPDNRKLTSTRYPEAYLHWRPGVATIGAFHAHEQFVISLFIQRPRAEATDLTDWADRALTAELAQLARFTATPADKLADLPVDPDRLLSRAVVEDRRGLRPDQNVFGVYSTAHLVNRAYDQTARQELVDATGADQIAVVDGGSITRTRDQSASEALMKGLIDSSDGFDTLPAPNDIPGAQCLKLRTPADDTYNYRCYVPYKRYLGIVSAEREPEVRQKVSAQYALLANSL
ncbi:hypothetical protein [Nocardia sp. AG03]|uniref:DUF7373 family lipoprotein n=1 Tax=Nocardia sp. AG03 TaxID=3025312 RepID=UPI0024184579|nr:hypothetical protein [Nocardia sp. AG03]